MAAPDAEIAFTARAYGRILERWPCPNCGQLYPCRCDCWEALAALADHRAELATDETQRRRNQRLSRYCAQRLARVILATSEAAA
jgi:hypothetical protein